MIFRYPNICIKDLIRINVVIITILIIVCSEKGRLPKIVFSVNYTHSHVLEIALGTTKNLRQRNLFDQVVVKFMFRIFITDLSLVTLVLTTSKRDENYQCVMLTR